MGGVAGECRSLYLDLRKGREGKGRGASDAWWETQRSSRMFVGS